MIWIALLAVTNLVAWAAFRIDKRRARKNLRRTPERRLLWLTLLGGGGALLGMYAHQHRHKVDKPRFRRRVWGLVVLQCVLIGVAVWLLA